MNAKEQDYIVTLISLPDPDRTRKRGRPEPKDFDPYYARVIISTGSRRLQPAIDNHLGGERTWSFYPLKLKFAAMSLRNTG